MSGDCIRRLLLTKIYVILILKPRANGRNIVGQQLPTLLDVACCVRLHTLLHVVACCWELLHKVLNRSKFWANNSQHSFVPWSPKRNATMLDPFTQLPQHCWGLSRSLHMVSKVSTRCTAGPKSIGSCCIRLHITANANATTPIIVASVCTGPNVSLLLQHMNYFRVKNCLTSSLSKWLKAMIWMNLTRFRVPFRCRQTNWFFTRVVEESNSGPLRTNLGSG